MSMAASERNPANAAPSEKPPHPLNKSTIVPRSLILRRTIPPGSCKTGDHNAKFCQVCRPGKPVGKEIFLGYLAGRFGGTIFRNAFSKCSRLSSASSIRAVSMNRPDCFSPALFRLFGFGEAFRRRAIGQQSASELSCRSGAFRRCPEQCDQHEPRR